MLRRLLPLLPLALAATLSHAAENEVLVLANDGLLGDTIVGTGGGSGSGTIPILNNPGFVYTNTRAGARQGIDDVYARSGNGSLLQTSSGGNAKADVEYYNAFSGDAAPFAMGRLADLTTLSYEHFRAAGGTTDAHQAVAFRLLVDADGSAATTDDRGYLIYEHIYDQQKRGLPTASPIDTWTQADVLAGPVWLRQFTPSSGSGGTYQRTISDWVTSPNPGLAGTTLSLNGGSAVVYGFSIGIGSGWNGTFSGAADNVRIGFGTGDVTRYNFERSATPVPEPATMAALGLGAVALLRRRKAAK